ncbi:MULTISPECIES: hypothetical protein [Paraburkholderia]|uniref:hypothetical protein n=1 Tax=Paraburkholderia TaxID=1822464 RepID=UPI0038BC122F
MSIERDGLKERRKENNRERPCRVTSEQMQQLDVPWRAPKFLRGWALVARNLKVKVINAGRVI